MTVSNLIDKLIKFSSLLYFRHWERWELLAIILISLVLLLLIIWQHRKATNRNVYLSPIRERSPIIGVKLADNTSHLKIEGLHPASSSKKQIKYKKTIEQFEKLNKQIQHLQLEIGKHKKTETRLERQITELKAANKKLQREAALNNQVKQSDKQLSEAVVSEQELQQKIPKHKQAGEYPKQQIIEIPALTEQQEAVKSKKTGQNSKRYTGDLTTPKKQSTKKVNKPKEPNWMLREKSQQLRASKESKDHPLDIQKLKTLADLAKQIHRHRQQ